MLGPIGGGDGRTQLAHATKKTGKPESAEQKKLLKACQDFESVMLGTIFKQMSASTGGDMLNQGAAAKQWREMLDDERAKSMAANGGLGLADAIYRQLADRV